MRLMVPSAASRMKSDGFSLTSSVIDNPLMSEIFLERIAALAFPVGPDSPLEFDHARAGAQS